MGIVLQSQEWIQMNHVCAKTVLPCIDPNKTKKNKLNNNDYNDEEEEMFGLCVGCWNSCTRENATNIEKQTW